MTNVALLQRKRKAVHGKSLDVQQIDLDAFMKPAVQTYHEYGRCLLLAGCIVAVLLALGFALVNSRVELFSDYSDVERTQNSIELAKSERQMALDSAAYYGV